MAALTGDNIVQFGNGPEVRVHDDLSFLSHDVLVKLRSAVRRIRAKQMGPVELAMAGPLTDKECDEIILAQAPEIRELYLKVIVDHGIDTESVRG